MVDWACLIAALSQRFPFLWGTAIVLLAMAALGAFVGCFGMIALGPEAFGLCFIAVFLVIALLELFFFASVLTFEVALALQGCVVAAAGVAGAAPGVAVGALTPGSAPGIAGGAVTPTDCAAAQTELANARAALTATETALRAQEQRVRDAQGRLRNAKTVTIAATTAVVALLVNPFGWGSLAGAIVAQVAALALVLRRSHQLGQELGKLS